MTPIGRQGDIGTGLPGRLLSRGHLTQTMRDAIASQRVVFSIVVTYRDGFRNHYRLSLIQRLRENVWVKEDEWRRREKVTPETDRTWDRF